MEETFTVLLHFMVPCVSPKRVVFGRHRFNDSLWGRWWSWLSHQLETKAYHRPQMEDGGRYPTVEWE